MNCKRFLLAVCLALLLVVPGWIMAAEWYPSAYTMSNADLSGTTYYIQYTTPNDGWYIKAIDTTTANVYLVTFSYVSGDTDPPTAWTNRATTGANGFSGVSTFKPFSTAFD